MSEDPRNRNDTGTGNPPPETASAFEDWLTQLSEETDQTTEEVFEQLVSAYWTLTEVFGLVERVGAESALFDPDARAERGAADDPAARERAGSVRAEDRAAARSADVDGLRAELERLKDRLSDAEAALADADSAAATAEEVTALAEHFDAVRAADRRRLDSLDDYVDAEFGNSRAILRRLIEGHRDRGDALADVRSELSAFREHVETEASLAELTRRANRLGVERADCESCGSTVRLALLAGPACPHCEARFEGIEPRAGRWFGSDVLTVVDDDTGGDARTAPEGRETVLPELARRDE